MELYNQPTQTGELVAVILRSVLTPFGQVDGSRTRWREGAGLGLPIAKSLIELHSGRLTIESTKDVGTTVSVMLPSRHAVTAFGQSEAMGYARTVESDPMSVI